MRIHSIARRSLRLAPAVVLAALAFDGGAAAAEPNTIEGVWSFNGGAVAISPLADGTFQGIVETETKFGECAHPAGQVMWTGIKQQSDGSFWGYHQWYDKNNASNECTMDPNLGPTAWRVLSNSAGAHYLEVCFSHPGTSQPKIAADGTATEDTFGCVNSNLIAPLPTVVPTNTVTLPPSGLCTRQKSLTIKLRDPKYDRLVEVLVKINGKKVADVKGIKRLEKGVKLKSLPTTATYKVSVLATTILKQHLSGSQTYRNCAKGSGKIKLHRRAKKHHG